MNKHEKRLKTEKSVDVLVVGGGSAGCFAAISAARLGAEVLLVEKNAMLGGTATVGMVNFPGLFHAWGKQIIDGPAWEAIMRCVRRGGAVLPPFPYKSEHHNMQQILVDIFTYTCVLDEMCAEAGVELLFHSMIAEVREKKSGVFATVTTKDGPLDVKAKILIDASGDADALRLAGYAYNVGETLQPATLINDLTGYDPSAIDETAFRAYIEQCYRDGRLTLEDSQGQDMYRRVKKQRIHTHIAAPDAHTSQGRTALELSARQTLSRILKCLSEFEGLENIRVARFGQECGVRETVRIVGEHQMTAEEYLQAEVRNDSVCYAFYPIDLHRETDIKQIFIEEGKVPSVYYGSLVPKGAKRMLVAGRCLSSDRDANSALRVQATCMAMGQVAGVAAASCAKYGLNVYDMPISVIKSGLIKIGAIVPENKKRGD